MNRRIWMSLVIVVLTLAISMNGYALTDKLSLKFSPSGIFTLGGRYSDQAKLRELVGLGIGLELGLRYELHNNVYFDFSCRGSWLPVQARRKPLAYQNNSPDSGQQNHSMQKAQHTPGCLIWD